MNKTLKIHFYLKKRGNYVSGNVPIYLRLTVDGVRTEFSTQREWDPSKWDQKSGSAIGEKRRDTTIEQFPGNLSIEDLNRTTLPDTRHFCFSVVIQGSLTRMFRS